MQNKIKTQRISEYSECSNSRTIYVYVIFYFQFNWSYKTIQNYFNKKYYHHQRKKWGSTWLPCGLYLTDDTGIITIKILLLV